MAVTIARSPDVAMPGRPVRVTFTADGTGANYVRAWITDAPYGSEWRAKLDKVAHSRIEIFAGDSGADLGGSWEFVPDRGGVYVLAAQEYTKGGAGGGGYAGAPLGYTTETKVGSENTLGVHVAQRLKRSVGSGADRADLVIWVTDTTIAATTVELHGEKTPALVGARTAKARIAARSTDVEAALASLGGSSVAAPTALRDVLADLVTKANAHFLATGGVHPAGDSDNVIPATWVTSASTESGLIAAVNQARVVLTRHMLNDDGTGTGAASYHDYADWTDAPVAKPAGNLAEATALLADLWRAFEAHRIATSISAGDVHGAADNTNVLAALPSDLDVDASYLAVLAALEPVAPPTENAGAASMVGARGFGDA